MYISTYERALCSELEEELRVFERGRGISPHPPFSYAGVSATLVPLAEASVSVIASCQGPGSRDSMDANSCKMRVVTYEASVRAYCSRERVSGVEVGGETYKRRGRERGIATAITLVIVTPSFDRGDEESKKGGTRKQRMGELTS